MFQSCSASRDSVGRTQTQTTPGNGNRKLFISNNEQKKWETCTKKGNKTELQIWTKIQTTETKQIRQTRRNNNGETRHNRAATTMKKQQATTDKGDKDYFYKRAGDHS